jgi:signal transduction histidine kinase
MLITPYIEKNYPKTRPLSGVNAIENDLIIHHFFIVMDYPEKYIGMLTISDVLARKKKLVADCLSPKPSIWPNATIEQAIKLMYSADLPALPVVDENKKFHGILSQKKLIETIKNFAKRKKKFYEDKISVSERIRDEFVRNISHEIRTPLNAIQGLSEILLYSELAKEDKEDFANLIHAKTDELLKVVDSLLHLSHLNTDEVQDNLEIKIDPGKLCQKIGAKARQIRASLNKNHIEIKQSIHLPESFKLNSSAPYLKQVIIHLLNNAFKFTDEGIVEFGCYSDDGNKAVFFVKDTGVGILHEKQKVIFDAFEKGWVSNQRTYPGVGIGLTIASKIIELAGGKIWVESTPGQGSCFYFSISAEEKKNIQ